MVTDCVTGRPCFLVEHWLFGFLSEATRLVRSSLRGAAERGPAGGRTPGTLLGPEEAAAFSGALTRAACGRGLPDGGSRRMVPSVS